MLFFQSNYKVYFVNETKTNFLKIKFLQILSYRDIKVYENFDTVNFGQKVSKKCYFAIALLNFFTTCKRRDQWCFYIKKKFFSSKITDVLLRYSLINFRNLNFVLENFKETLFCSCIASISQITFKMRTKLYFSKQLLF